MNLFAVFPIGATIQDGGKRKRSDSDVIYYMTVFTCLFIIQKIK